MKKCLKIFLCLLLSFVLAFGSTISVFASDLNDGENDGYDRFMGGTNIEGFNHWDTTSKKSFWLENFATFCAKIGLVIKTGNVDGLYESHINYLIENERIADADSYDEFIASHLSANEEETELYMSNDLSNTLYNASVQYIEENTGWYNVPTRTVNDIQASWFSDKSVYDHMVDNVNALSGNEILFIKTGSIDSDGNAWFDGVIYDNANTFVFSRSYSTAVTNTLLEYNIGGYKTLCCTPYDSDWNSLSGTLYTRYFNNGTTEESSSKIAYGNSPMKLFDIDSSTGLYTWFAGPYTTDGRIIRLYKTFDEMKAYSVGQRTYYVTDKFVNYDSTVDNSTTITQTEIDNSVTYGDVYNYITNNYENPDGLTEDELRAILEEYLSSINNSGGSGSGSGSGDNSGGSGGGLSGFLDGLGSIGNAILAILGKLMEILGSAIELVTGSITDLITIIPNSIGELLGALFPVFPEEWIKAITLSLVLGVIVGIVRMFK